jgi:predicted glycogen debranching enzyme
MDLDAEWLESDDAGGFASGTVGLVRTRRYHALLLAASRPPAARFVLVNGLEAWIETPSGRFALTTQFYAPDILTPDGRLHIASFSATPWPNWDYALPDGTGIAHDLFVHRASGETVLRWRRTAGTGACRLLVRPLISGRDYHGLHHENPAFAMQAAVLGSSVAWRPYPDVPPIAALSNGHYRAEPEWYRNFLYAMEQARGMECIEDLAAPGIFAFDLAQGEAVLILRAGAPAEGAAEAHEAAAHEAAAHAATLADAERKRRAGTPDSLALAAASYGARRGSGRTLMAGFPWFTDWGRDTFIAMRGLVLAEGRLDEAEAILAAWADLVSEGMLPNRFADAGDALEYNSVDASLWFVIAVHDFLEASGARPAIEARLAGAVAAILEGYAHGTRYRIGLDADGLIRAGEPGVQLTWMDAKVGDWVVTPRIGKPVEVQALWINALRIARRWSPDWAKLEARARDAFLARFPNPAGGLFDVVDADHVRGRTDGRIRPNQILAVGGLPFPVLTGAAARGVVDLVEAKLLTPLGLRSLAPEDPDYAPHYQGGLRARDGAYHQGTVWPWLIGPFVDAWLRTRDNSDAARAEAREKFLPPLMAHLATAGLGHVSEIADGDPPHTPRGCPFQAWSLGELIRVRHMLGDPDTRR